jgi:hypothetical protein
MANKLELIENYVVFSDTATGDNLGEYAVNHCVYTEETDRFEIKEVIDNGRLTITKADLLAEKWVDGSLVAYTEETMRDFLRANTGFKAAGGGSPVLPYKVYAAIIAQAGTNPPQVVTLLENTLSGTPVWSRVGIGDYRLTLVGEFTGRKTAILTGNKSYSLSPNMITPYDVIVGESNSPDELYINTLNNLGSMDNVLGAQGYGFFIEVRIYP